MKKFFSAILLMTMMVFSVGTFVSCNDLVSEIEGVKEQATANETAIKALNDEIAALETALASAQAAADAAKSAADAASAAAAEAKADAIAEAKTMVEALKAAYEAKVAEIETALAGKATQADIDAAVDEASKNVTAALDVINTKLAAIEETLAAKADKSELDAEVAKLLAADTEINVQIEALKKYIEALEGGSNVQVDSIKAELSDLAGEIEDVWAYLTDENTGLYALVAGNASAITAMQEDFEDALESFREEIYGEGPNSLFTQVGQHAGLIQSLDERMTEVESAIASVNANLLSYKSILEGLAKQIQSITFVPETFGAAVSNYITAQQYWLGEDQNNAAWTPVMIKATYEINPKGLVAEIEDENLAFETVETKAAPAEYFPVKVIDRDSATGRMTVVGYVPANSQVAKSGNGYSVALNIADANIFYLEDEDGLQSPVDAGSYVSSSYTYVNGAYKSSVVEGIKLSYLNEDGNRVYPNSYYRSFEVPYTPVGEATAQNLFEVDGLVFNLDGIYLSLDKASEVLGMELDVTCGDAKATFNAAQGKKSPIVVTGTKLETVATLVGSADYEGSKALHQKATVVIKDFKVNGEIPASHISLTGIYEIGYKKADITLSNPPMINWHYSYGPSWAEWDYDLAGNAELDVTGVADITILKDMNGNVFSPNNILTFNGEAYDSKGQKYYGFIEVNSLSKKALRILGGYLEFAKGEELTYVFNTLLYDNNNVEYTTKFEVKVGAMPTDKVITLDPVTVGARTSSAMTANISPILATLAADAAYYPEATDPKKAPALLNEFLSSSYFYPLVVTEGKTEITNGHQFNFAWGQNGEASYIEIPKASVEAGDVLSFEQKINIFGVDYTYKVNAQVEKPSFSLIPNAMFVNTGDVNTVDLVGKVTLPTFKNTVGSTAAVAYELPLIDVRDYVLVNGETAQDIVNEELTLKYKVTTVKKDKDGNVVKSGADFASLAHETTLTSTKVEDWTNVLTWNLADEDALYRNTIELEIELVATDNDKLSYGKVDVQVVVPELIKVDTVAPNKSKGTGAYSEYLNDAWTVANVVKGLKVTDAATSIDLYNKYAADLTQIWKGVEYDKATKDYVTIADEHYNAYGQTAVVIDSENVTATYANGATVPAELYNVDTKGNVTLAANTGHITSDIIVKVPVSFKHNFCGTTHAKTVEVRFYK